MNQDLWRVDRPAGFLMITLAFLAFEVILRAKLGVIFSLAAAWVMVQQWLLARSEGDRSPFTGEKLMIGLFYGFAISAIIFLVFAALNIGLRTLNNSWNFFQLP
jgi:hypothetical protein